MDHRLRTDNDAAAHGTFRKRHFGSPLLPPCAATTPADVSPPNDQRSVLWPPETPAAANGPFYHVGDLQAEIVRLRQLLVTTQKQLGDVQQESLAQKQKDEQALCRARNEIADARKANLARARQLEILKQELKNVAIVAVTEHQSLKEKHASTLRCQDAVISEKSQQIESLQAQSTELQERLKLWQIAQHQAVSTGQWYDVQIRAQRNELSRARQESAQFRAEAAEAFDVYEEEIETLEATVGILRTDHETVELVNADLDHLNDCLQSEIDTLQNDLESVVAKSSRDRQESIRAIDTLREQLRTTSTRLATVSEEKQSLLASVSGLKTASDEFDASLFAKDQEIDAIRRLAGKTQQQLGQLRREHAVSEGQNDDLRNRVREMSSHLTELKSELSEKSELVAAAEARIAEQGRQLREIQSAARAAEANALLRANEAEQQFAIEVDRLETALEQGNRSQIAELERALSTTKRAAAASSAENDRLQQTIDQQNRRIGELQLAADAKDGRLELLEETLSQLQADAQRHVDEMTRLKHDFDARGAQLAEYADRVATQQHAMSCQGQELAATTEKLEQANHAASLQPSDPWQSRIDELEQTLVMLRERHHQSQLSREQTIESLTQNLRDVTAERDVLGARVNELSGTNRQLTEQLTDWAVYKNPIGEAKRLSAELARHLAQHARERESLLQRIERLQESREVQRAA